MKKLQGYYTGRSLQTKGSLSISSNYEDHSDYWPEVITQIIIMGSTIVFSSLGLDNSFKIDALKSYYEKLELEKDAISDPKNESTD